MALLTRRLRALLGSTSLGTTHHCYKPNRFPHSSTIITKSFFRIYNTPGLSRGFSSIPTSLTAFRSPLAVSIFQKHDNRCTTTVYPTCPLLPITHRTVLLSRAQCERRMTTTKDKPPTTNFPHHQHIKGGGTSSNASYQQQTYRGSNFGGTTRFASTPKTHDPGSGGNKDKKNNEPAFPNKEKAKPNTPTNSLPNNADDKKKTPTGYPSGAFPRQKGPPPRAPVEPALGKGISGREPGAERNRTPQTAGWTTTEEQGNKPATEDKKRPFPPQYHEPFSSEIKKNETVPADQKQAESRVSQDWSEASGSKMHQMGFEDAGASRPILASKLHDAGRVLVILAAFYLIYKVLRYIGNGVTRVFSTHRSRVENFYDQDLAATTKQIFDQQTLSSSKVSERKQQNENTATMPPNASKDYNSVYATLPPNAQLVTAPSPKDVHKLHSSESSEDNDSTEEESSDEGEDPPTDATQQGDHSSATLIDDPPLLPPEDGIHADTLDAIAELLPKTEKETILSSSNESDVSDRSSAAVCVPSSQLDPETKPTDDTDNQSSDEDSSTAAAESATDGDEEDASEAENDENAVSVLSGRFGAALKELLEALGSDKLEFDYDSRKERRKDAWSHHQGSIPIAIAFPETTEDVSTLLRICNKHQLPVVAYGCGTSLEGHTVDSVGGVVCDMSRMSKVLAFRPEDSDITVETGIEWMAINDALKDTRLFFPMDPGPGASIGGMIGTCCSGTNAVHYGVMRDWILKIKIVLADGTVTELGTRARKDTAGYDLIRLFTGAEGTLGIITEATLRLAPKPEHELAAMCAFPSTKDACSAVTDVIRQGTPVHGAEYLDSLAVKIMNTDSELNLQESPSVMFKFGGTATQLEEAKRETENLCIKHNGQRFISFSSQENKQEFERFWGARKNLLYTVIGWGQDRQSWITDVCVPLGRLPSVMQETIDDISGSRLDAPVFGHVGDGNFHATLLFHANDPEEIQEVEALNHRIIMRALQAEGTCTGEHGIGLGKREYLKQQLSPAALDIMMKIKHCLDPNGILNPNKIFTPDDYKKLYNKTSN